MNKILLFTILAVILLSVSFTSVSALSPENEKKLNDKLKSLEKKINELVAENTKLKSESNKSKSENFKLKNENTKLKSENTKLKTSSTKYTSPPESTKSTTPKDNLSKSPLYSQAVEWNYKDMLRNPEKYQGKVIAVTGKVSAVKWPTDEDNYYYPNYYDIITPEGVISSYLFFLVYDGILLTDDKISVVGYVEGYNMDMGDPTPIIKVAYLEFID